MKLFIKNNFKVVCAFVIGLIISGITVYAISASEITYDNTTVDAALDDLYTKANSTFGEYVSVINGDTQFDFSNIKRSGFKKFKIANQWNNGATCSVKVINTSTWLEENSPYSLDTQYDLPDSNRLLLRATNGQCDFILSLYR